MDGSDRQGRAERTVHLPVPHYWWGAFKNRRTEIRDYLELGSWEGQSIVLAGWLFPNAHLTAVDWFSNPKVGEGSE